MGATANLLNEVEKISTGLDPVVIRRAGGRILGGRTLDVTGFEDEKVIKAGHVIIRSTEDETVYKPMPVEDGAYAALPEGYEYAGVLVRTVLVKDARAAIQYDGEVNDKACPYSIDDIKADLKAALPSLYFMHD